MLRKSIHKNSNLFKICSLISKILIKILLNLKIDLPKTSGRFSLPVGKFTILINYFEIELNHTNNNFENFKKTFTIFFEYY